MKKTYVYCVVRIMTKLRVDEGFMGYQKPWRVGEKQSGAAKSGEDGLV